MRKRSISEPARSRSSWIGDVRLASRRPRSGCRRTAVQYGRSVARGRPARTIGVVLEAVAQRLSRCTACRSTRQASRSSASGRAGSPRGRGEAPGEPRAWRRDRQWRRSATGGSDGTGAHGWLGGHGATGGAGALRKMSSTGDYGEDDEQPPTKKTRMRPAPTSRGAGCDGAQRRPIRRRRLGGCP